MYFLLLDISASHWPIQQIAKRRLEIISADILISSSGPFHQVFSCFWFLTIFSFYEKYIKKTFIEI